MSLESNLKSKHSRLRRWFEENTNRKAITAFVKEINNQIFLNKPFVVENSDPQLVGTTFPYVFQWLFEPLDFCTAHARLGVDRGFTEEWVVTMPEVASLIIEIGNFDTSLEHRIRYSILLAWFEQFGRSLMYMPEPLVYVQNNMLKENIEPWDIVEKLLEFIPMPVVVDVMQLVMYVDQVWGEDLKHSFIFNPSLAGSRDVGGADADWITRSYLYECKCIKQPRPFGRQILLQTLSYILLDYENQHDIGGFGWYFVRQRFRIEKTFSEIFPKIGLNEDISWYRDNLKLTLSANSTKSDI